MVGVWCYGYTLLIAHHYMLTCHQKAARPGGGQSTGICPNVETGLPGLFNPGGVVRAYGSPCRMEVVGGGVLRSGCNDE